MYVDVVGASALTVGAGNFWIAFGTKGTLLSNYNGPLCVFVGFFCLVGLFFEGDSDGAFLCTEIGALACGAELVHS